MPEFHNRQTGLIHTVLHSPDGGAVVGAHHTLKEAHDWAAKAVASVPGPERGSDDSHKYIHREDSPSGNGKILGVYDKRAHGTQVTLGAR